MATTSSSSVMIALVTLFLSIIGADGFVVGAGHQHAVSRSFGQRGLQHQTLTSEQMMVEAAMESPTFSQQPEITARDLFKSDDITKFSKPLAAAGAALHASLLPMLNNFGSSMMGDSMDNSQASHVLGALSHLSLDVVSAVEAPSVMAVRLASVAGQLFSISADYLPDHAVAPQDMTVQMVMLYLAFSGLIKAASHSTISNFLSPVNSLDKEAFNALFKSAGMTWNQYKGLSAFAMDWVTVEEGDIVSTVSQDNSYSYWLCQGNLTPACEKSPSLNSASTEPVLLGAIDFLRQINQSPGQKKDTASASAEKWTVGTGGATLLRMNKEAVSSLLNEYDGSLKHPIRNMLTRGVKANLNQALSR